MMLVAICIVIPQRMHLSGTVMEIWHLKDNRVTTLIFWCHVTIRLPGLTPYGWSIVTMWLSSTIIKIWPFEVLPGRLFQEQKSVVSQSSILHWSHILLFTTLGT